MTSATANGIGLTAILRNVSMNEVDDVRADRGLQDIRKRDGVAAISGHVGFERLNGDERAGGGSHGWGACGGD